MSCTKRELLSLIGLLQHAAKVVVPGRTFVRRLINLSSSRSLVVARVLSLLARSQLLSLPPLGTSSRFPIDH